VAIDGLEHLSGDNLAFRALRQLLNMPPPAPALFILPTVFSSGGLMT